MYTLSLLPTIKQEEPSLDPSYFPFTYYYMLYPVVSFLYPNAKGESQYNLLGELFTYFLLVCTIFLLQY
jgi:hypothetical protein